jgi:hypothetical protein
VPWKGRAASKLSFRLAFRMLLPRHPLRSRIIPRSSELFPGAVLRAWLTVLSAEIVLFARNSR